MYDLLRYTIHTRNAHLQLSLTRNWSCTVSETKALTPNPNALKWKKIKFMNITNIVIKAYLILISHNYYLRATSIIGVDQVLLNYMHIMMNSNFKAFDKCTLV